MPAFIDLTGRNFGRLTVLAQAPRARGRGAYWTCRCECGSERVVMAGSLSSGQTRSCGCLKNELTAKRSATHGHNGGGRRTPTNASWHAMLQRCRNPNAPGYADYGGRGITVCDRWLRFENFLSDMGARPQGKSLDRINNDGDYTPENCRWATQAEQNRNMRRNRIVTYEGVRMPLVDAAAKSGLRVLVIYKRLYAGWPESHWFIPRAPGHALKFRPGAPSSAPGAVRAK